MVVKGHATGPHALPGPCRGFVAAFFTAWGVFSPQKSMTFPPAATAVHSPPASG